MKQFLQGFKDGSAIGIGYLSVSFTFGLAAATLFLIADLMLLFVPLT